MTELSSIKGVGPKRAEAIKKLGVNSVEELLAYFPKRYADFTRPRTFSSVLDGDNVLICGRVCDGLKVRYINGKTLSTLTVIDELGQKAHISWFYKVFNRFEINDVYYFCGKAKRRNNTVFLNNPEFEKGSLRRLGGIRTYYALNAELKQSFFRSAVRNAYEAFCMDIRETLPESFAERNGLEPRRLEIRDLHFPQTIEDVARAMERREFEELLLYKCAVNRITEMRNHIAGHSFIVDDDRLSSFLSRLPFALTKAQRSALNEIRTDMAKPYAMNRMLQGDVGCGKTVVAFAAVYIATSCGEQAALIAPTEIVARQHYQEALKYFDSASVVLLLGAMPAAEKQAAAARIASGEAAVVVGTHAVFSSSVRFRSLGLVIVDEQHRFGVRQRALALEKGDNPDMLIMSATPIPRTLRFAVLGELDVSIIDELPPGRKIVKTRHVPATKTADMFAFLRREAEAGRQGYIVCPQIDDEEESDLHSAVGVFEQLRKNELKGLRLGLLYSELNEEEKRDVLARFERGEIDILVSTIIVEVGVNIPNASFMVVYDADRYGMAQLHQLRGRVGRGEWQSYCFLLYEGENPVAMERIRTLTVNNNGFAIAQKDLEMRKGGDFIGFRQSGAPGLDISEYIFDTGMMQRVEKALKQIKTDPGYAEEYRRICRLAEEKFAERLDEVVLN